LGKVNSSTYGFSTVEFECPVRRNSGASITIKIRNNSIEDYFYFCAINFVHLSEWKRQYVNNFKAIGNTLSAFIDHNGASDYAFQDSEGLFFGSYHGGEVREYGKCSWVSNSIEEVDSYSTLTDFSLIPMGEWRVISDLRMVQRTKLISKANMVTEYDFNIDGTVEMKFGLYNSTINFKSIYTALTCTNSSFSHVSYPKYLSLPSPNEEDIEIPSNEGIITQHNELEGLDLTIRFTKFNELKNARKAVILNNSNYRKFYYGVIVYQYPAIPVQHLSFSKGLDFVVR
jgi:hypothetical protein